MSTVVEPGLLTQQAETRSELIARANALIPLLRAEGDAIEKSGRLTEPVVQAVREAGLFNGCAPRSSGFPGGGVRTLVELTAELARGDASTGWVAFIANTTAYMTSHLAESVREAVYADPDTILISQFGAAFVAREVDGGYRVSGKSAFASGCLHADWTLTGAAVLDGSGAFKELRWVLISRADLDIEHTWNVAGMKGTGSNTWIVDDVFVPFEHTVDAPHFTGYEFTEHVPAEPIYRAPIGSLACLGIMGPIMGMAEAAWDLTLEIMESGRAVTGYHEDIRDAPSYQLALADARLLIDTGRFHLLRASDEVDRAAVEGRILDLPTRAAIRADAAAATTAFRDAVDLMLDIGGTRSFSLSNPIQRVWRDIEVATRHGLNNRLMNREEYGLTLVGKEPGFPIVL